jgi:hypothetical protein
MAEEKINSEIDVQDSDVKKNVANTESIEDVENTINNAKQNETSNEVRLEIKRKRFTKSDILVLCACLVTSVLVWLYASSLQKKDDENKLTKDDMLSKDDIIEVVESNMNKATEGSTDVAE